MKGFLKPVKSSQGATIIEVIVSIGIIAVIMTAVMAMVVSAINSSDLSKTRTIATNYANEGLEVVRTVRDVTDWTSFVASYNNGGASTICNTCYVTNSGSLTGTSSSAANISPYTRTITFSDGGSGRVAVDVKVTWPFHGQTQTAELVTYLTDWHK